MAMPTLVRRGTIEQLEQQLATVSEGLAAETANTEFLQENLAQLELAIDEQGWQRLSMEAEWEFTRDGLDRIIALSRLNALKNPLIRSGVHIKADYVTGQGVEIAARDPEINELVVQPFLDDPLNASCLFGDVAFSSKDRALTTDGNLAFVLFPNMLTGHVSVRSISIDEIRDKVCNPNDAQEPWFYLRRWTERTVSLDGYAGGFRTAQREAWYPDWRFQPAAGQRPESIGGVQVRWDTPIYHVAVGGLDGMRFGVPETYAALDWAKAFKLFLEDWATIVRSLSKFSMALTVKKNPGAAATRLGATGGSTGPNTNPSPVPGAVFVASEGTKLEAIPKTDAVIKSEDGLLLAKMVAAALRIPYTWLMGDSDQGNLATAKTLDRPTQLGFEARQRVWKQVLSDLTGYAIDWAIRAPGGPLAGTTVKGPDGKVRWVPQDTTVEKIGPAGEKTTLPVTGAERRTVDVTFPKLAEENVLDRVQAIVLAAQTELIDEQWVLRLLCSVLGIDDVDELVAALPERLERMRDSVGDVAVNDFRAGRDPARQLGDEEDP